MLEIIKSLIPNSSESILTVLEHDHDVLRGYVKELKDLKESESKKLSALLAKFETELVQHSRSEEKSFYVPFIAKNKESEIHVLEGFEEHMLIDNIVAKLKRAPLGSPVYQARLKVVSELLEHHLGDEEKEHFPLAKKKFSSEELDAMGAKYLALKHSSKKGTAQKNLKAAKEKPVKNSSKKPARKTK